MKNFFGKLWSNVKGGAKSVGSFASKHKIITGIIVLVIIGGGYWGYTVYAAGNGGTQYVLAAATKGPLQVTVTGSGQVSANDELTLSPQASGQITEINVTAGQSVKAGQVIARIDSTTADQAVQSAQSDLESAQISYQQSLASDQTGLSNDQSSVNTDIATTYTDLPTVMNGLDSVLHSLSTATGYTAEENINAYANYINSTEAISDEKETANAYAAAVTSYQQTLALYNSTNNSTLTMAQSEQLAQSTLTTLTTINTALTDTLSYYNYINDQIESGHLIAPTQLSSEISSLDTYESTISNDETNLTNAENSLENDSQTLDQSPSNETLAQQSAQLTLQKAQEALDQAEQNEADYVVTAPFDGTIASVAAHVYDQAGSGTTIATLITPDEYADLSLNEADVAKVQVGQAAELTFDALPNVTMAGTVASVSDVGTVTSGVVTYDVKIGFNTVNSAIKPGMTVDATIVTDSVASAIQVPSAAVHTTGNYSYVEVATLKTGSSTPSTASSTAGFARRTRTASSTGAYGGFGGASTTGAFGSTTSSTSIAVTTPITTRTLTEPAADVTVKNVPVVIGVNNDTMTQITSGLTVGQLVVTATESAASKTTKTAAASATSLLGGTGATGARTGFTGGGYAGGGGAGFSGGAGRGG